MSSRILVDEIYGKTSSASALTIDSSGRVLKSVIPAWRLKCTETSYTSSGVKDLPIDTTVDADLTTDNARFITGGVTVSGNVVTVPVTGFYQINTVVRVDNIGSGYVEIRQRVNDTATNSLNVAVQAPSATYEKLVLTEVQYLQANDEIHYYVQSSSDTSWEIEDNSVISGILIG